jgi:hypothetical protein
VRKNMPIANMENCCFRKEFSGESENTEIENSHPLSEKEIIMNWAIKTGHGCCSHPKANSCPICFAPNAPGPKECGMELGKKKII